MEIEIQMQIKTLKFGFGNNNQPTGIVARAGETIIVYVDVEPGKPLPQLMFSQQEGSFANWGRTVSLHSGKNCNNCISSYSK